MKITNYFCPNLFKTIKYTYIISNKRVLKYEEKIIIDKCIEDMKKLKKKNVTPESISSLNYSFESDKSKKSNIETLYQKIEFFIQKIMKKSKQVGS
jgi:hypothetical protein